MVTIEQLQKLSQEDIKTMSLPDLKPFFIKLCKGASKELADKYMVQPAYISMILSGKRESKVIENDVRERFLQGIKNLEILQE